MVEEQRILDNGNIPRSPQSQTLPLIAPPVLHHFSTRWPIPNEGAKLIDTYRWFQNRWEQMSLWVQAQAKIFRSANHIAEFHNYLQFVTTILIATIPKN